MRFAMPFLRNYLTTPGGGGPSGGGGENVEYYANPLSGTGYTFGARLESYGYGTLPTSVVSSPTTADNNLKTHWDDILADHLLDDTTITTIPGGIAPNSPGLGIVSEGIGYFMLMAVIMDGYTNGSAYTSKEIFDGCLTVYRAMPAETNYDLLVAASNPRPWLGRKLMEWRLNTDGTSYPDGDQISAPDGDLDVALALLMADRQWGSTGTWDYAQEAANTIEAIKVCWFDADGTIQSIPKPGGYSWDTNSFVCVRTSDFMFQHFRAFARHMQDNFWYGASTTTQGRGNAYDRSAALADYIQTTFSSSGLLPDFVEGTEDDTPIVAQDIPGHGDPTLIPLITDNAPVGVEGPEDVYYNKTARHYYNAFRNMWRYATDYVFHGGAAVKTICDRHSDFYQSVITGAAGDVTAINDGYELDGSAHAYAGTGEAPEQMGPVLAGFLTDATYATELDSMWSWNTSTGWPGTGAAGYYSGEIQFLSKVVASGNWWEPNPTVSYP